LEKFKKVDKESGHAPFNSFASFEGSLYAASENGLYKIEDVPLDDPVNGYKGLEGPISDPLRNYVYIWQLADGFNNINPNVPFNKKIENRAGGKGHTIVDEILDNLIIPRDFDAELAGYVYLAISQGLSIQVSTSWYEEKPKRTKKGWKFGRLLELAAEQAGVALPIGRDGMEGLMKRGKASAEEMLAPVITESDGRTFSYFALEFPEA
jgi:hypothetical protein